MNAIMSIKCYPTAFLAVYLVCALFLAHTDAVGDENACKGRTLPIRTANILKIFKTKYQRN